MKGKTDYCTSNTQAHKRQKFFTTGILQGDRFLCAIFIAVKVDVPWNHDLNTISKPHEAPPFCYKFYMNFFPSFDQLLIRDGTYLCKGYIP